MSTQKTDPLNDFRNVVWAVWNHLGLPEPTPVQYDIAQWLQRGPRRQITEAFRGVGKSWITSVFCVDALRHIPDLNILVVSAAKTRADDFSTFTLRLIREVPIFQHLTPRDDQRDSKISFDVAPAPPSHAPSVKSVGILGQITGSRADIVIADDVESANNSATQMMRDKLAEIIKEFDAVLKPVPSDDEIRARAPGLPLELARQYFGRVIYLGTPQTESTIYGKLEERGYKCRIWPVRYPNTAQCAKYGARLAPTILDTASKDEAKVGKSTDPARFGEYDLMEREASYGRSGFALQFMLDTSMSDANRYPLRLSDLIVTDLDDEVTHEKYVWASSPDQMWKNLPNVGMNGDLLYRPMALQGQMVPYQGAVLAIDPSGRGKDETAYAVVKHINGQLCLMDAGGFMGGYTPQVLTGLSKLAQRYKVNKVITESNYGDGMFSALLAPVLQTYHPCQIEEVRHSIQKEKRIVDTLEPVMNQHRLVVHRGLVEKDFNGVHPEVPVEHQIRYQLFYQLTRITRDRGALVHDDRLDAVSIAVAYWVEAMKLDADKRMTQASDDRRKKSLQDFVRSVTKGRMQGQTFFSTNRGTKR
jgi:hypothetical protein